MSMDAVILLSGFLIVTLLVLGGFIMHVHYIPSRPLLATFGFVAVSALILTIFGMVFMFFYSMMD